MPIVFGLICLAALGLAGAIAASVTGKNDEKKDEGKNMKAESIPDLVRKEVREIERERRAKRRELEAAARRVKDPDPDPSDDDDDDDDGGTDDSE